MTEKARQILLFAMSLVVLLIVSLSGIVVASADEEASKFGVTAAAITASILVSARVIRKRPNSEYSEYQLRRIVLMAAKTTRRTIQLLTVGLLIAVAAVILGPLSVRPVFFDCGPNVSPTWSGWFGRDLAMPCNRKTEVWAPFETRGIMAKSFKCYQGHLSPSGGMKPLPVKEVPPGDGDVEELVCSSAPIVEVPEAPKSLLPAADLPCLDYQKQVSWSAGCTPETAAGFYWKPDRSYTSKYGNFGVVYEGIAVCDAGHVGDHAAGVVWPPSHDTWSMAAHICPNGVPGPDRGNCPADSPLPSSQYTSSRPLTECPEGFENVPTCGIYRMTCTKINQ
jgi:hypothetical protein